MGTIARCSVAPRDGMVLLIRAKKLLVRAMVRAARARFEMHERLGDVGFETQPAAVFHRAFGFRDQPAQQIAGIAVAALVSDECHGQEYMRKLYKFQEALSI